LDFRNQNSTSFIHNCHILKPELLLPKTTTVQFVNSCGFKKQQFWFKDVTVLATRCVVLIPESQKLKEKDLLRRNKLRGLVIGRPKLHFHNITFLGWRLPLSRFRN
jgi:hypothetical protein